MLWKRSFLCLLLGLLASCSTSKPKKEPELPMNRLEVPVPQPVLPPMPDGSTVPPDQNTVTLSSGMRLPTIGNKLPDNQDMQAVVPSGQDSRANITSSPPQANIPPADKKKDETVKPQQ